MSSQRFFKAYTDLINHPCVIKAPPAYRWVLITILDRMCYANCQQDDHGMNIDLKPGQLLCTEENLVEWANVTKNEVHRAIKRFKNAKIVNQEVRRKKNLLTIIWEPFYLPESRNEPRSEPRFSEIKNEKVNQKVNQEVNQSRTRKPDGIDNLDRATTPTPPIEKVVVEVFFSCVDELAIDIDNKRKLMDYSEERIKLALDYVNQRGDKIRDFMGSMIWHCRLKNPPVSTAIANQTEQQKAAVNYTKYLSENGWDEIAQENTTMIARGKYFKCLIGGVFMTSSLNNPLKEIVNDIEMSKNEIKMKIRR